MSLKEDLVAHPGVVLAPKEVVEAHLVQGGGAGVGGEVPADRLGPGVGPDHHDGGVPPDVGANPALEVLIAGEVGFGVGGDGVDVRRGHGGRKVDVVFAGSLQ